MKGLFGNVLPSWFKRPKKPMVCFWCGKPLGQITSKIKPPHLGCRVSFHGRPGLVTGEECCAVWFDRAFRNAVGDIGLQLQERVTKHVAYRLYVRMLKSNPGSLPFLGKFLNHKRETIRDVYRAGDSRGETVH
jgi:hypothetical protein